MKSEIKRQRSLKGDRVNYGKVFESITKKYYIIPRKYNADHTMTRYYRHEYMSAEAFLRIMDASVLFEADSFADGKVLSLYSLAKIDSTKVRKHIKELNCGKLIVICPKITFNMLKQALDYEILQELKNNRSFMADNEILKRELPVLEEDLSRELEEVLYGMYEEDDGCRLFYLNGEVCPPRRLKKWKK